MRSLVVTSLPVLAASFAAPQRCKPVVPASWAQIDFDEYTRATWYAQEQETNSYQSADELFCTAATYELEGRQVMASPGVPWDGLVISVYNQDNQGGVNQITEPQNAEPLCGRVVEPETNTLSVAPCFLPNTAAGPYLPVILKADNTGRYTAVAVIGGQPTLPQADGGCSLPRPEGNFNPGGNNEGLWILTREPVAPADLIDEIKAELLSLGISTANMLKVTQEGCTYKGFKIKPNE